MSAPSVWSPSRLQEALAEFRAETSKHGAPHRVAGRLSARWGVQLTAASVERALFRTGLGAWGQYVGQSTPVSTGQNVGSSAEVHADCEEPRTEPSHRLSVPVPRKPEPEEPPTDPVQEHLEKLRATRDRGDRRELLERLAIAEERVRFLDGISGSLPPASIRRREKTSGLREATAVALASDWHVEETVDPAKVEGLNEYNLAIADKRIAKFFSSFEWLIDYHRHGFEVRDAILWLGGDLLSGFIHEELMEANELSPTETVLFLRQRLRDGIRGLLQDKRLERLIIPCNYGNHGRTTEKKRIGTGAENSFEWLLYHVLSGDFAEEPRVRFLVAHGEHVYVQAYDFMLHFTHGDSVNYGGGVGGISVPVNKAVASWNTVKRAAIHNFGHFHQRLEGRDWCANGSLIGYSPYAFHVKAQYEPPQQSFYLVDSRRGRCQSSPLWVDESSPVAA